MSVHEKSLARPSSLIYGASLYCSPSFLFVFDPGKEEEGEQSSSSESSPFYFWMENYHNMRDQQWCVVAIEWCSSVLTFCAYFVDWYVC